jgi:hypothetical protein
MHRIRGKLTYSNVISTLCLFLLLGGGTAFAAGKLAKNSVGSKQLKKNSVTAAKLKNNAVTGAKIANGAVTGAKVANSSLTGANINLATLGQVPSANTANSANTVNGQTPTKVYKTLLPGESNVVVASIAGFTLTSSCEAHDSDVTLTSPSSSGSVLSSEGAGFEGPTEYSVFNYESEKAGNSSVLRLDESSSGPINLAYGETSFSGATAGGAAISGDIGYDYETFDEEAPPRCIVFGQVTSG